MSFPVSAVFGLLVLTFGFNLGSREFALNYLYSIKDVIATVYHPFPTAEDIFS